MSLKFLGVKEKSFVIIKPDGIQRSLIGKIISRIEKTGLKLVAIKFALATEDQCLRHYDKDDKWCEEKGQITIDNRSKVGLSIEKSALEYGRDILQGNVSFLTCCPLLMMVWEGNQATGVIKKIVGSTEPLSSDVGTIRGDLTLDSYELANVDGRAVRNLIHCSDKPSEAERELNVWFKENEIMNYRLVAEKMLYDVNLDGIKE